MREINPFLLDPEDSHDQESHFGSGNNDFSPEVTHHYLEMTECGRNLNYGFIPRPIDKSVIIACQCYINLFTNDIYNLFQ